MLDHFSSLAVTAETHFKPFATCEFQVDYMLHFESELQFDPRNRKKFLLLVETGNADKFWLLKCLEG